MLTSKRYATEAIRTIDPGKATSSETLGLNAPLPGEAKQTTHYTVIDMMGNAVSNTYTINGWYGSGATVRGAGFLLNNEMDDFSVKAGVPNQFGLIQGGANEIAPGKRPLSSMTPTIALKDGKLCFAVGSPGGPTIINTVLQIILNVTDHQMNLSQAVAAPRIHHQWRPDVIAYEPSGLSAATISALKLKGQRFADAPGYLGDATGVAVDPKTGGLVGVPDPRNLEGAAAGH
jgi:gamma-glutamyltranspeptidase/glutathione hydrolase